MLWTDVTQNGTGSKELVKPVDKYLDALSVPCIIHYLQEHTKVVTQTIQMRTLYVTLNTRKILIRILKYGGPFE